LTDDSILFLHKAIHVY